MCLTRSQPSQGNHALLVAGLNLNFPQGLANTMSASDVTEISLMTRVTQHLLALHQQRSTGTLIITLTNPPFSEWQLFFYLGRIVYATGGVHPVRRWHRAVRLHCPELLLSGWLMHVHPHSDQLWEVDVLNQAVEQNQISAVQARNVVQRIVCEVIFAFIEQKYFNVTWQPSRVVAKQTAFLAVEPVIQEAYTLRQAWREAGLGHLQALLSQFSPDLAPIVRNAPLLQAQVAPLLYHNLVHIMQGKRSLWDVAVKMQRPLPAVIRSLLPLMRQGIVELVDIPDLPHPYPCQNYKPSLQGRIACIDDSPAVARTLEQILGPLGYHIDMISNPLEGIAMLWANKPDLIFLDLVMPNSNGYELCTFLRKTTAFQDIPIIILTGSDGVIDRMRAKMAGASEFMTKPPAPDKVLTVVQKYIR
jgi:two-component system, chemotaxis family, response regulator PixG